MVWGGFVAHFAPGQIRWQGLALGLLRLRVTCFLAQRFEFLRQDLKINVGVFFEEAPLVCVELLGLGGKAQAFDDRHLVGETIDQGLLGFEVFDQRGGEFAQLHFIEAVDFYV